MGSGRRQRTPQGPYEIRIDDLTHEAAGVGHRDGKAVFIPDALPGERVSYLSVFRRRDFDRGRLVEVLEASPQRVTPKCPHFGLCGGCSLQHLEPGAQIEFKQRQLLGNLQRIGKVEPETLLPPITGPVWGYRRRARLSSRHVVKKGRVLVGFHERDAPVVAVLNSCDVLDAKFGYGLLKLSELIGSLSIRDGIPQIEISVADNAHAMVIRVLAEPAAQDREKLIAFSKAENIWIFLQAGGADSLQPLLADTPELIYRLPAHNVEIAFAPNDFVQINHAVNEQMVDKALALLEPQADDCVLELFSGLGNFTLPIARRVAQVVAVEGEQGLVQRAQANAARNGITNVVHHKTDLITAKSPPWLEAGYNKLLLDPPRAGAQEILPQVLARQPQRIVYVSCHPGTLARDAGVLVHEHGYRLRAAGVMDMFPHTSHVESMALFEAG